MKKILSLVLVFAFVIAVLVGCGGNNDKKTETTTADEGGSTTEAVEKKWYDGLDYDGTELTIACRGVAYDEYVVGIEGGDVLWDTVYQVNEKINGALNVKREFLLGSSSASEFNAAAVREAEANPGLYDMIMPDQFYGTAYSANGSFLNVNDLDVDNNYINTSASCWYGDYMSNIIMGTKTLYFLAGDISPTILGWAACSFVNWNMYEDLFGDPNEFLSLVEEGKWTVDVLMEKCTAAYLDLDDNKKVTLDDRLGAATSKGQSALFAMIAAGFTESKRTNEGTYELTVADEHNDNVFNKIYDLYNNTTGFFAYEYSASPTGNVDTFAAGRMLFMNEYFLYAFKATMREMTDSYVTIPRPKYDENQEKYLSSMQDSFFLYALPASNSTEKLECVTAYLQRACEMYSDEVIPAMYDTCLKIKYVSDEVDADLASKLIDFVRQGITSDFAVVYTSSLSNFPNMPGNLVQNKQKKWNAYATSQTVAWNALLEDLQLQFDISE